MQTRRDVIDVTDLKEMFTRSEVGIEELKYVIPRFRNIAIQDAIESADYREGKMVRWDATAALVEIETLRENTQDGLTEEEERLIAMCNEIYDAIHPRLLAEEFLDGTIDQVKVNLVELNDRLTMVIDTTTC